MGSVVQINSLPQRASVRRKESRDGVVGKAEVKREKERRSGNKKRKEDKMKKMENDMNRKHKVDTNVALDRLKLFLINQTGQKFVNQDHPSLFLTHIHAHSECIRGYLCSN